MTDTQLDTHIKTALKFHFPTSVVVGIWKRQNLTSGKQASKQQRREYNENSNDYDNSNSDGNVVNSHDSNGADDEQCK